MSEQAEQLTFGGGSEKVGPPEEQIPDDVQQALNVVTGNAPFPGMGDEDQVRIGEKQDLIKAGMLKKSDRVEKFIRLEGAKVEVFDISDPEEAEKMARVIDLVGDPRNGIEGQWTPPQTMLDRRAKRGFRTIVTVKYWKVVKDAKIIAQGPTSVSTGAQPVKFDAPQNASSTPDPTATPEAGPGGLGSSSSGTT